MEITGRKSIGGLSTKLGFDKSKVTCFKCKQKCHSKRECRNAYAADDSENPFNEDYYKKSIYHQNKYEPPRLKQPEEKSRALAVMYDDEGYDWSQVCPEEDAVGYAFVADADPDRWWKADYCHTPNFHVSPVGPVGDCRDVVDIIINIMHSGSKKYIFISTE
ncbi:putative transcription factor interactor and regulator CCHC(Zn) family [Helianthus anomalus]